MHPANSTPGATCRAREGYHRHAPSFLPPSQNKQMPLQHALPFLQKVPLGLQPCPAACALFASPKQANAMPARPTPNFLSAAQRVTDCAMLFVSSSNLLFILFLSFGLLFFCPITEDTDDWDFVPAASVPIRAIRG